MFQVSKYTKESPFIIDNFMYAFGGESRRINICSDDMRAAEALRMRIQKNTKGYDIHINGTDEYDLGLVISDTRTLVPTNSKNTCIMSRDDAKGIIEPIRQLDETNWLMMKYLEDAIYKAGLLSDEGTELKVQRDKWRSGVDKHIDMELNIQFDAIPNVSLQYSIDETSTVIDLDGKI